MDDELWVANCDVIVLHYLTILPDPCGPAVLDNTHIAGSNPAQHTDVRPWLLSCPLYTETFFI
jgi:hypothetical protein